MSDEDKRHDTPTDINEIKLSSDPEVAARRMKIARLRWVRKFTIEQIVQATSIPERTVYRDLAAVKKANDKAKKTGGLKRNTNTVIAELELAHADRQRERWQEYHGTKDVALRRRFLNDIADDEEKHAKLLQTMGVIDKIADNVNILSETWPDKVKRLKAERQAAATDAAQPDPE